MSSGGYAASSSGCVTRPRAREIGSTGYAGPTQHSLLIGRYVMATAEHREPCDSRGSCTVLGAPGGEIPPGDSTNSVFLLGAARPLPPSADIGPGGQPIGQAAQFCLGRRVASPVTATTDFLAPDILNKCGRAGPALIHPPKGVNFGSAAPML